MVGVGALSVLAACSGKLVLRMMGNQTDFRVTYKPGIECNRFDPSCVQE